ncbi:unnamed protein product [Acanthoscelides obtectus]|uniref:Uncharacterized protein n=1 Tax=Acanthoscelides obtectus TaxID=200917 RepID=A0A9P0L5W8_ACAOB|nr:unnamed protein product [Acanthoscelides obtectus]CAK1671512.1 hypothetical protein AOBTE_LOCUS28286 [Acanthoscelides obtectus]
MYIYLFIHGFPLELPDTLWHRMSDVCTCFCRNHRLIRTMYQEKFAIHKREIGHHSIFLHGPRIEW